MSATRRCWATISAMSIGLAGVVACRAGAPRDVPPDGDDGSAGHPSPSAPAPSATSSARADAEARARASLETTLRRVANARGLAARRPVELKTLNREELLAHLLKKVEKELPPGVLALQGEALRAFGVLPPGYEFEKGILALLQGQIAGFYDPDERAMFLLDDLSDTSRDETLNHELVHALQDQAFDLSARLKYREGQGDASAATQALIEGDATSAMFDVAQGPAITAQIDKAALRKMFSLSAALSPSGAAAPSILKSSVFSSYVDGFAFVQQLRARDNWATVDAAFVTPPVTTEQVLHLDKFDKREPAVPVVDPIAGLPPDFSVAYTDAMGELGLRLLLEEWVPRETAERAAAGWGGDRYVVARRTPSSGPPEYAVAAILAMDTAADAAELEEALLSNFTTRCTDRKNLGPLAFRRADKTLWMVAGPYALAGTDEQARGKCAGTKAWLDALQKSTTAR